MKYESGVVLNTINVFYTGSFYHTIPVIFQFTKIYPFLINPLLILIFIPSFFYILFIGIKNRNIPYLLLTTYYLLLFLSQAFFFAKWTRYMVPTIPFMYLIIAIAIMDVATRSEATKQSLRSTRLPRSKFTLSKVEGLAMTVLIFTSTLFGTSYFITAFVKPDTRIEANKFAKKIVTINTKILSEPYDLGLMPFNSLSQNIEIFNFYEFDNNSPLFDGETLNRELQTSNYIILPSQRVLRSRLLVKDKFPKGNAIYSLLTHDALGYQKIYQTPCDILCKITYLGDPVFSLEETATVFDRPTVFIFKKIK